METTTTEQELFDAIAELAPMLRSGAGQAEASRGPLADTVQALRDRGFFRRYFAGPSPADEPPTINGDPFTNSQEHPTRFSVEFGAADGTETTVSVRFADGWKQYRLQYLLILEPPGWRIDDVVLRSGTLLSDLLAGGSEASTNVPLPAQSVSPANSTAGEAVVR